MSRPKPEKSANAPEKSGIAKRLRAVRVLLVGASWGAQTLFARQLGIKESTYGGWEKGTSPPKAYLFSALGKVYPGVSLHWLATGGGTPFRVRGSEAEYKLGTGGGKLGDEKGPDDMDTSGILRSRACGDLEALAECLAEIRERLGAVEGRLDMGQSGRVGEGEGKGEAGGED